MTQNVYVKLTIYEISLAPFTMANQLQIDQSFNTYILSLIKMFFVLTGLNLVYFLVMCYTMLPSFDLNRKNKLADFLQMTLRKQNQMQEQI